MKRWSTAGYGGFQPCLSFQDRMSFRHWGQASTYCSLYITCMWHNVFFHKACSLPLTRKWGTFSPFLSSGSPKSVVSNQALQGLPPNWTRKSKFVPCVRDSPCAKLLRDLSSEKIGLDIPALCCSCVIPASWLTSAFLLQRWRFCVSQVELSFFSPKDTNSCLFSRTISESEFVNLNYSMFWESRHLFVDCPLTPAY